jgi:hypothetical protein
MLAGLTDFVIDAAKALVVSTAAGALVGALFGGVGALPGAQIGFELGVLILEVYGLAMLVEAILSIAGDLMPQLGNFVRLVWEANGDPEALDDAGKALAEALAIMASAALIAAAAYVTKKGGEAITQSAFAVRVGQTQLARWLADRQRMTTTKNVMNRPEAVSGKHEHQAIAAPGSAALRIRITERAEQLVAHANTVVDRAVRTGDRAYFEGLGMSENRINRILNPGHKLFKAEYGNAMELTVAREIAADPLLSASVRHIGTQRGHVAGTGKPDFVIDADAWGHQQFMDVTTRGQRAAHILRDYGKRVLQLTYEIDTYP